MRVMLEEEDVVWNTSYRPSNELKWEPLRPEIWDNIATMKVTKEDLKLSENIKGAWEDDITNMCAICCGWLYEEEDQELCRLVCDHKFHKDCLHEWF